VPEHVPDGLEGASRGGKEPHSHVGLGDDGWMARGVSRVRLEGAPINGQGRQRKHRPVQGVNIRCRSLSAVNRGRCQDHPPEFFGHLGILGILILPTDQDFKGSKDCKDSALGRTIRR